MFENLFNRWELRSPRNRNADMAVDPTREIKMTRSIQVAQPHAIRACNEHEIPVPQRGFVMAAFITACAQEFATGARIKADFELKGE